jgi:hypothetical protein
MKKLFTIALFFLAVTTPLHADTGGGATPGNVYDLVLKAHDVVKQLGEDALPAFNDPKGEFIYKDAYVFVMKCPAEVVAHPYAIDKLKGRDLRTVYSFHNDFCEAAEDPNGSWIEYEWPKPGESTPSRKVAFSISVEGTPYALGAGIYNKTAKVEDLNKSLR